MDPVKIIATLEEHGDESYKKRRPTSINSREGLELKGISVPYDAKKYAHVNFTKALLCSVSFLGMYIALYSA
jgi:hypothetical protein